MKLKLIYVLLLWFTPYLCIIVKPTRICLNYIYTIIPRYKQPISPTGCCLYRRWLFHTKSLTPQTDSCLYRVLLISREHCIYRRIMIIQREYSLQTIHILIKLGSPAECRQIYLEIHHNSSIKIKNMWNSSNTVVSS